MPHGFRPDAVTPRIGTTYPKPFDAIAPTRRKHPLGDHANLTQYGVNFVVLPPGEGSSQRHWHASEDEFVYVLTGEITLITDEGEEILKPGMCAGFPSGVPNGHHLMNRTTADATYLEIGTRAAEDEATYPDIDLHFRKTAAGRQFTNREGKGL